MRRYQNFSLPIISPRAVAAYLKRPLDSYDFLKQVPKDELLKEAHAQGMRFATESWQHQLVCFAIASRLPSFLFLLKQGGGKSKIILDQIRYRKRRGELLRALVLVPELLHMASWEEQIKTHAPDLKYRILLGDKEQRMADINKPADLIVMNFAGLSVFMTELVKDKNKKRQKQVLASKKAADFASFFNFVAYDELHRVVDTWSIYYQMFRYLSLICNYRYGLTGTPFGRDPTPLWGQLNLIDHGQTLGQTLGIFRQAFFTPHKHHFKGIDWRFKNNMTGELNRIIKNRSITYETTEYQDMPKRLSIRVPVRLTGEAKAYYDRIIEGIIEARGDYSSLSSSFTRMRQCASGFLALKADDASRIEVQFKHNPKLDALQEFLLARPDEKILVFHEFTHSGRLIEKMLTGVKVGFSSVRGETKDIAGEYQRFLTDPRKRIFVLNNQLGSEAINPQYVCRRAIFYESPVDPKRREQAETRVWRPGQEYTVFIHDLLVLGSIEEKILKYIKQGKDLSRVILAGDEKLVEEQHEFEL